jgi:hypothetical protein
MNVLCFKFSLHFPEEIVGNNRESLRKIGIWAEIYTLHFRYKKAELPITETRRSAKRFYTEE